MIQLFKRVVMGSSLFSVCMYGNFLKTLFLVRAITTEAMDDRLDEDERLAQMVYVLLFWIQHLLIGTYLLPDMAPT